MSDHARAICFMLATQFCSAWMGVFVRTLSGQGLHSFQIVFLTLLFALIIRLPWLLQTGRKGLETTKLRLYLTRSVLEVIGFTLVFTAMTMIPLPQVTSLQFLSPLFFSLMATLVLKEESGWHTWLALFGGFLGVLVITRPGVETFDVGGLLVVGAALCFGTCGTIIRVISRTDPPARITFYMLLFTTFFAGIPVTLHWQQPSWESLKWAILAGIVFFLMQHFVTKALSLVPATKVTPFAFTQLIFVSIVAYVFYGEIIAPRTLAGGSLIFLSAMVGYYAGRRKQKRMHYEQRNR
ncbi:MAG: DMT family transporter [Hyphomicrobiales bacterium]|nr:DMT family transporter [Hyphomicrobiales bacterium]